MTSMFFQTVAALNALDSQNQWGIIRRDQHILFGKNTGDAGEFEPIGEGTFADLVARYGIHSALGLLNQALAQLSDLCLAAIEENGKPIEWLDGLDQ